MVVFVVAAVYSVNFFCGLGGLVALFSLFCVVWVAVRGFSWLCGVSVLGVFAGFCLRLFFGGLVLLGGCGVGVFFCPVGECVLD